MTKTAPAESRPDPVIEGCLKAIMRWEMDALLPLTDHLEEQGHPLRAEVLGVTERLHAATAQYLDGTRKPRRGWGAGEEVGVRICVARKEIAKLFGRKWKDAWRKGRRRDFGSPGTRLTKGYWCFNWTWQVIREAWSKNHLRKGKGVVR